MIGAKWHCLFREFIRQIELRPRFLSYSFDRFMDYSSSWEGDCTFSVKKT